MKLNLWKINYFEWNFVVNQGFSTLNFWCSFQTCRQVCQTRCYRNFIETIRTITHTQSSASEKANQLRFLWMEEKSRSLLDAFCSFQLWNEPTIRFIITSQNILTLSASTYRSKEKYTNDDWSIIIMSSNRGNNMNYIVTKILLFERYSK